MQKLEQITLSLIGKYRRLYKILADLEREQSHSHRQNRNHRDCLFQ